MSNAKFRRTKTLDREYHPDEEFSRHDKILPDDDDDDEDPSSDEDDDDDETPPEITNYLAKFGMERGRTSDDLREWHKNWAVANPSVGDPPPSDCKAGCHWKDEEFSLACMACIDASTAIGTTTTDTCKPAK